MAKREDHYKIMAKIILILDLPKDLSQHKSEDIKKISKAAKILYFPKKCPKCGNPYPKEHPDLVFLNDGFQCFECAENLFGEVLTDVLKEEK